MTEKRLKPMQLKNLGDKDVGAILNDGGGLRGRVRKNRAGEIKVHFELKYREGKKFRTAKVEAWPTKSLAEIRAICRDMKTQLAQGVDPIDQRKDEKLAAKLEQAQEAERKREEIARLAEEAANRRTLSTAIEQWEKTALSRRKDGGKDTMRSIRKDVLPTLGDVTLIDVRRAMLVDVLDAIVERGSKSMANHLFADLKQFFNFAIAREWVDRHPLAGLTKEKIGGRQKERERFLTEAEIIELHQRLPAANLAPTTELAIWIMLSTGCRVGEISQARWADVDLDQGQWWIPPDNSKNARELTVFLSDFSMQQFQDLKTITGDTAWCLPSRNRKKHIGLKTITKQIRDRVRTKPLPHRTKATGTLLLSGGEWRSHDLRRSAATLMGELGVMGEIIERCLNHIEPNPLKRTYQRQERKGEQRAAWRRLGERLVLLQSAAENENVIVGRFSQSA